MRLHPSDWPYLIWLTATIIGSAIMISLLGMRLQAPPAAALADDPAEVATLLASNDTMRAEIERLDRQLASSPSPDGGGKLAESTEALNQLRAVNGAAAVTGPGVSVEVSGPASAANLRDLVNELKSAGAEALAINELRLTLWSAIYEGQSGPVLDGHRLEDPVVIEAIGDPATLREALLRPGGLVPMIEANGVALAISERPAPNELRLPLALQPRSLQRARLP